MRPFIRLVGIAVIVTSLSACETARQDKKVEISQPMSDTAMRETYADMIRYKDSGSVQVFSLDSDMPSAPPRDSAYGVGVDSVAPMLPQGQGKPYGGDSSVMVFPLDNNTGHGGRGDIPPMITPYDQGLNAADGAARIYFSHGAVGVNGAGKEVTSHVASQCRAVGCGIVKVEGHASTRAVAKDEVQRRLINLKVSMDRAMSVSRQLIRDGVAADAIQVTAHGDRVPPVVPYGADPESAARRVEIVTGVSNPLMY